MSANSPNKDSPVSLAQLLAAVSLMPAQALLNRLIYADSAAAAAMGIFEDKVVAIESSSPELSLRVHLQKSRLQLSLLDSTFSGLEPDVTIKAKSADVISLLFTRNQDRALANPALTIEGDGHLLHELFKTFASLDLDFAAHLSPILGDSLSHQVESAGVRGKAWSTEFKSRMDRNITDYVQEEARLSPTRSEVDSFYDELATLGLSLDRLDARIGMVESNVAKGAES